MQHTHPHPKESLQLSSLSLQLIVLPVSFHTAGCIFTGGGRVQGTAWGEGERTTIIPSFCKQCSLIDFHSPHCTGWSLSLSPQSGIYNVVYYYSKVISTKTNGTKTKASSKNPITAAPKKFNMTCQCGEGRIGERRNETVKRRIVNGYVPETRPWMVYIQVDLLTLVEKQGPRLGRAWHGKAFLHSPPPTFFLPKWLPFNFCSSTFMHVLSLF